MQKLFGARELGSRHHFHGLGDLLDALDGLQASGNWLKTDATMERNGDLVSECLVTIVASAEKLSTW